MTLAAREARAGYLFLLPALVLYLLFLAIPLVAALALSFYEVDRLERDFTFAGLANFAWIYSDPRFWTTLRNTFFFISMSVIGNVGLGLLLAIALDRAMPTPVLYILRLAWFLPVLVSLAVVSFVWRFMFGTDLGVINHYLGQFGLPRIGWLTDGDVAMISVIILDVWKNVGFFVIVFLAALQGVPRTLLEAASIDGARPLVVLTRIKIPWMAPVILFCVVHATIGGLQVFDSVRILTNGGPGDATRPVVMYMVSEAFSIGDLGTGAAAALTLLIVIMIVVALQLLVTRAFRRGGRV